VLPPEQEGTDVRMRIFTPDDELPMAGHPTIGSTFALARTGVLAPGRERVVFGLGIGPVPVTLTWSGEDLSFAWMTQLNPTFDDRRLDPADAAAALSLPVDAVAGTGLPVQVVSCGVPFVFVPLTKRSAVDSAVRDPSGLAALLRSAGEAQGVFLFSAEPGSDGATVYSRLFAAGPGIIEDPATGIASGPLGCYLIRYKLVEPDRAGAMLSLQGVKMGRPSHVHISIGMRNDEITSVRVGGESVLAGEGTLYV